MDPDALFREEMLGIVSFPPTCMSTCQGQGLWQECVLAFSPHFDMGIFSFIQGVEVIMLISGFLSERTAPCIHLVCSWEKVNSGPSMLSSWTRQSLIIYNRVCYTVLNFTIVGLIIKYLLQKLLKATFILFI